MKKKLNIDYNFLVKLCEIRGIFSMSNYLLTTDLQILPEVFFDEIYIFGSNFKKCYVSAKICNQKKKLRSKIIFLKKINKCYMNYFLIKRVASN